MSLSELLDRLYLILGKKSCVSIWMVAVFWDQKIIDRIDVQFIPK